MLHSGIAARTGEFGHGDVSKTTKIYRDLETKSLPEGEAVDAPGEPARPFFFSRGFRLLAFGFWLESRTAGRLLVAGKAKRVSQDLERKAKSQ